MMKTLVSQPNRTEPLLVEAMPRELGNHDVLVDVAAAAVNPVDVGVVLGPMRDIAGLEGVVGLGWDVAGVVAAVGAAVTSLRVGDRVAGLDDDLTRTSRTHAAQVVLPESAVAVVPDGLDLVDAASVPLNALTADQALAALGAPAGRTLLVTGAGGAVGGYAVALASAAGWSVVGHGRDRDEEFVRAAGAREFVTVLPAAAVDAVFDTAGLQENAIGALRDGGRFQGVYPMAVVESVRDIETSAVLVHADASRLAGLLHRSVTGELAVRVAGRIPLDEAAVAYAKLAGGGQRGRWLLVP
jgi:NADPH:quinone reductase-like Zn-dependent oxidoreductase